MSDNDGVLIPRYVTITRDLRHGPLRLIQMGDIHYDSPACAMDILRADLKQLRKDHTPNTYYSLLGDAFDFMSGSERKMTRDLHDSTNASFSRICDANIKALAGELAFTRGRWLGMVQGNHHLKYEDGTTSTHRLCRALDAPYLGDVGYVAIQFAWNGNHKIRFDIVMAHGKAGGKLAGTSINQVDDLKRIFPEADIYVMGHNHDRGVWPTTSLRFNSRTKGGPMRLVHKEQLLVRSGSYLRGYTPGKPSYVASRLLRPTSLGHVEIEVTVVQLGKHSEAVAVPKFRCIS